MTNILLVCDSSELNGAERSILANVDLLRERFSFSVAVPVPSRTADAFYRRGIHVYPLVTRDESGVTLPLAVRREMFAQLLDRFIMNAAGDSNPGSGLLVHANSLAAGRVIGPVCRQRGVTSLAHIRDIIGLSAQVVADLNCHSRLLCVSSAVRDFHLKQGLSIEKSIVIYNGVDTSVYAPMSSGTSSAVPDSAVPATSDCGKIRIGTAGQITLRKGFECFLESCRLLKERFENSGFENSGFEKTVFEFEIAGSRQSLKGETVELESRLYEYVQLHLPGQVRFLGQLDSLSGWLPTLDIYVHAARQEPLGRVLLEAGAVGLPIIATDVGGTREIFTAGSAILVPPDDPVSIADAMIGFVVNERRRKESGLQARAVIVERFTVQTAAENLSRVYLESL